MRVRTWLLSCRVSLMLCFVFTQSICAGSSLPPSCPICSTLLDPSTPYPRCNPPRTGPYNTAEIEGLLGVKLVDLYEGNASALRVLGANGALSWLSSR